MENENPIAPAAIEPLAYAPMMQATAALHAYVYVGWYFLITSSVSVLASVSYVLMAIQMRTPSLAGPQMLSGISMMIAVVGASGMVRARRWGTYVLMAAAAVTFCYSSLGNVLALSGATYGRWYSLTTYGTSLVQAVAMALLPYLLLRLCRKHDAFLR